MTKISAENQNLAQFVGKVFGGDWLMAAHNDEHGQAVVYTLAGKDEANPGIISHATIGLSDYELGQDKSGIALGAELVCAGYERFDYIDLALANAARFVMDNKLKFKLNCTVRSLSEHGARLSLGEPQSAPDTFELLIELDAVRVKCEVIWRGNDQIGVKFTSGFRPVKPTRVQVVQDSTLSVADTATGRGNG